MNPIQGTYNLLLVGLSFAISVLGSYAALRVARRIPAH
jgi:NO-binding membrane sensor protein with MHYT domain